MSLSAENFILVIVSIIAVIGPMIAWVIRVEKILARLSVTVSMIYHKLERRSAPRASSDDT